MRTPEQIEEILDKVEKLLGDFDAANDKFDRGEWSKKFGERFKPYDEKLKRLNGDDFDLMNASYDEYHKDYSDITDDQYADALEDNIKKVIEKVWPSAPEEEKEAIAEHVAEDMEDHKDGEVEVSVKTEDKEPEVEVVDTDKEGEDEEITSDARTKRVNKMKDSWKGSPHTSGGRDGTVSDEDAKEDAKDEEKDAADKAAEDVDEEADFLKELEDYKASHKM